MPYCRLSGFYFFYFASLGALLPYWSLYLAAQDYSARQIGSLMAIMMLTKVVSPMVWGWISDHTGKRNRVIRFGSFASILCFSAVFFADSFWWLAAAMALYSFFWNATLPQFEVITFNHIGEKNHLYSYIRLWGSIGFIVSVGVLGWGLDHIGALQLPWVILSLFVSIWLFSLWVPDDNGQTRSSEHPHLWGVLKQPPVIALMLVCFLMQFSHGPYYTFYTLYLQQNQFSHATIGVLWVVGVLAELLVFLYMRSLIDALGLRKLLLASLLIAALRWYLIGHFVAYWPVLLIAQLFHAASFGIYHVTAIQLVNRYFVGKHQGRGQALYSSVSFGLGGALGSYFSGITWQQADGASLSFSVAAVAVLLAWVIGLRWVR